VPFGLGEFDLAEGFGTAGGELAEGRA